MGYVDRLGVKLIPRFKVDLVVKRNAHWYSVDGSADLLPSVTGILQVIAKPGLIGWARNQALGAMADAITDAILAAPERQLAVDLDWLHKTIEEAKNRPQKILEEAGNYGTLAHTYFDKMVKGEPLGEIPEAIKSSVLAFQGWVNEAGFTFVAGDTKVVSKKYGYGGSLDALAVDREGKLVLLDWKTSNAIREEYCLQVSAYARALLESFDLQLADGSIANANVEKAFIVRFGKNKPDWEIREIFSLEQSFLAFFHAACLKDIMSLNHFVEDKSSKEIINANGTSQKGSRAEESASGRTGKGNRGRRQRGLDLPAGTSHAKALNVRGTRKNSGDVRQ